MAMQQPEDKTALVLRLVDQLDLSSDEQDRLIDQLKLKWLCRELGKAEEQLRRGEGIPAEEVFAELEAEYERRKANV